MERVFSKLRNLDAYPKINEDFYNRTLSGGIITLVASVIMLVLFVNELGMFPTFSSQKFVFFIDLLTGMTLEWNGFKGFI